jgi:CDP-glycerol glycerophosphotransferase (TagB/SpsB family)
VRGDRALVTAVIAGTPIGERIGFVVHEPTMWAHYSSVWREMDPDRFAIVLTERFRPARIAGRNPGATAFVDKARAAGYAMVFASDMLRAGQRCKYAVSNHKLGGHSLEPASAAMRAASFAARVGKRTVDGALALARRPAKYGTSGFAPMQYWPLQVGQRQVRFMYGADIGDGWSLADWNAMYDAFLCHGPNDAHELAKRFRGRTFEMGYPRYDAYFDPALDVSAERAEFHIDPAKPTVLWMPTFGEGACSIPFFAEALAPLARDFNLVVRPHPLSFRENPEQVELLRRLGFRIDGEATRDMNRLYRIADAVLCDYGGSAFGALYLGKRMVLLDVPGSADWYTVRDSSNLELARHYPSLTPETAGTLPALLADTAYWSDQGPKARALSDKYFADLRGTSSRRAADLLLSMDARLAAPNP